MQFMLLMLLKNLKIIPELFNECGGCGDRMKNRKAFYMEHIYHLKDKRGNTKNEIL